LESEDQHHEEVAANLFFQLSSTDRRHILSVLQKENLKLNEVTRRLDMTATEALRQLQRLTEASLLEKMSDGKYGLTFYAKLVLDTVSPLDFISRYNKYFEDHDALRLPYEFRARLAELSGVVFIPTTIDTINRVTEMVKGAQKRMDAVVLGSEALLELTRQRVQEGLKVRGLMEKRLVSEAPSFLLTWKPLPEIRVTPTLVGFVVVTDKAALLALPGNDGELSYESFYGEDDSFRKWADDLFTYEWEKAKPWYP